MQCHIEAEKKSVERYLNIRIDKTYLSVEIRSRGKEE